MSPLTASTKTDSGDRGGMLAVLSGWGAWELVWSDPDRWRPKALVGRVFDWVRAKPRRWWMVRITVLVTVLFVIPMTVGVVAEADPSLVALSNGSGNVGISWTGVRDSSGLSLGSYMFALRGLQFWEVIPNMVGAVLQLEYAGFLVIATLALAVIQFGLSFEWLNWVSRAFTEVGNSLSREIATPILLAVAVTIGAAFVAYFVVRGYHARAALQVATMVIVALLSVTYLSAPLSDVLSSNGLLAQGRNLGLEVASGLTGGGSSDGNAMAQSVQGMLADNFVRHPTQLWNYGQVLDPGCGAAWTAGVRSGDEDTLNREVRSCAGITNESPTMGQVGAGLVMLIFGLILVLFGAQLGFKIFMATISSIYHGMLAIFGFAAGGYVYGPTQTFLIRNFVHMVGDTAAMVAYTIYLGVYALVLNDLFKAVPGSGMMGVILVGGFLMVAAMHLLRRLHKSLEAGNEAIADRIAAAVQRPASAGVGGPVSGIAEASTHGNLAAMLGPWAAFRALDTMNASFGAGWLTGDGRARLHAQRTQYDSADAQWSTYNHLSAGRTSGALNALRRAASASDDPRSRSIRDRLRAAEHAGAGLNLTERDLNSTLEVFGMDRNDVNFLFGKDQPANLRWYRISEAVDGLLDQGIAGPALSSALRAFGLDPDNASIAVREQASMKSRHPNPSGDRFTKLLYARDSLEMVMGTYNSSVTGLTPHRQIAQMRTQGKLLHSHTSKDVEISGGLTAAEESLSNEIIAAASGVGGPDEIGAVFDRARWQSIDQRVLTGTVNRLGGEYEELTRQFLDGSMSFDEAERNQRLLNMSQKLRQLDKIEAYGISVNRNPYQV